MGSHNYLQNTNKEKRKIAEERQRAFIENTAPIELSALPILSDRQRKAMDEQNLLIRYAAEKLGIDAYAISRDKSGHPVVFEFKYLRGQSIPELYCYALGLNTETNKMMAYCIGSNTFKFTKGYGFVYPEPSIPVENNLQVHILSIHPAFDNQGIGRLLLQASENYAISLGMQSMSLKEEVCYAPNLKLITPADHTKVIKDKEKYFRDYYFDKNMYFYYSQGFEHDRTTDHSLDIDERLVPLKKDRLHRITLAYGLDKPLVKVERTNPMFKIKPEDDSYASTAREYCYNNKFPLFLNNIDSSEFSPLVLKPNDSYTRFLHAFITTKKGKRVYVPTAQQKRFTAQRVINSTLSGEFAESPYKFSQLCSRPEFIQHTIELYEQAIDVRNPNRLYVPSKAELLRELEEKYHDEFFLPQQNNEDNTEPNA